MLQHHFQPSSTRLCDFLAPPVRKYFELHPNRWPGHKPSNIKDVCKSSCFHLKIHPFCRYVFWVDFGWPTNWNWCMFFFISNRSFKLLKVLSPSNVTLSRFRPGVCLKIRDGIEVIGLLNGLMAEGRELMEIPNKYRQQNHRRWTLNVLYPDLKPLKMLGSPCKFRCFLTEFTESCGNFQVGKFPAGGVASSNGSGKSSATFGRGFSLSATKKSRFEKEQQQQQQEQQEASYKKKSVIQWYVLLWQSVFFIKFGARQFW